jgi:hypothetical protein
MNVEILEAKDPGNQVEVARIKKKNEKNGKGMSMNPVVCLRTLVS